MTITKYISFMAEILKGRISGKRIPLLVTLCVTSQCNFKCKYCYCNTEGRDLTTREILDLIDQLAEMGTKYISLNGGEPLLKEGIDEIIEKVNSKNILCHLSTNGSLVEQHIPALRKVDSLAVSIDGIEESNDLNRGEGTFEKAIRGMEVLIKNKIKFHTHTVLTKNNPMAVEEVLVLAQRFGFRAQFSLLRGFPEMELEVGPLRATVNRIIRYKRESFPVFLSLSSYRNVLDWPHKGKELVNEDHWSGSPCYIKRFACHIEPDGLVYPCIVLVNTMRKQFIKPHNLLDIGFKEAWESLAMNTCGGCYNVCCNEQNFLFGLKPEVVWNNLKIVWERVRTSLAI